MYAYCNLIIQFMNTPRGDNEVGANGGIADNLVEGQIPNAASDCLKMSMAGLYANGWDTMSWDAGHYFDKTLEQYLASEGMEAVKGSAAFKLKGVLAEVKEGSIETSGQLRERIFEVLNVRASEWRE